MSSKLLFAIFIVVISSPGCGLSFGRDSEVVFAPTEVGSPEGDKITKNIGPTGGSLASEDGRCLLTVPPNAVSEMTEFSMQPITNKSSNGLGLAYRLGPNGAKFKTPLEISFRFDDSDIAGTVPEALMLAYQDEQGAWRAQKSARLDQSAKTLTIPTDHFTDFAFMARLRILPTEKSVKVNESVQISLIECADPSLVDRALGRQGRLCRPVMIPETRWRLRGEGTLTTEGRYTAPPKKPTPNTALVSVEMDFDVWDPNTGEGTRGTKTFTTRITIIAGGYKAEGSFGPNRFSGTICDLGTPFKVSTSNPFMPKFTFTPTSENGGTWSYPYVGVSGQGAGTYVLGGPVEQRTSIIVTGIGTVVAPVTGTGGGTVRIGLTPLGPVEDCGNEH